MLGLLEGWQRLLDAGYAAGAAGKFSLEAGAYRAGYLRLYELYTRVNEARVSIEHRAQGVRPESVSAHIAGVAMGSTHAHMRVQSAADPRAIVSQLTSLEAELAQLLHGMHGAFAATAATDRDTAAVIAKQGQ